MSSQMDNERKFREDLEKAQALSLESLALEKFRLEKLRSQQNTTANQQSKDGNRQKTSLAPQRSSSVTRMHGNTSYLETISRPRPGSFNTKHCLPRIRPPPQNLRRNSVTNGGGPSADLISFNSPSASKHQQDDVTQFVFRDTSDGNEDKNLSQVVESLKSLNSLFTAYATNPASNNNLTQSTCYNSSYIMNNYSLNKSDQTRLPANSLPSTTSETDSSLKVLKVLGKRDNSNLIDLTAFDFEHRNDKNLGASLLETFDPLHSLPAERSKSSEKESDEEQLDRSIYDPYDPFDFLYSAPSVDSQGSEPIYSTITKCPNTPTTGPPLPPRNKVPVYATSSKVQMRRQSRLYENVVRNRRSALVDPDLLAFHTLVKELRGKFKYTDSSTNLGLVISPSIEHNYNSGTSVKLVIHCPTLENNSNVTFTCDVSSTVEHVLGHVACEIGHDSISDHILKVYGQEEYLEIQSSLCDYEYVHQCIKLDKDIELTYLDVSTLHRPFLRTAEDDIRDCQITLDDLIPKEPVQPISHESLLILLETLEKEIERVVTTCKEMYNSSSNETVANLQTESVKQAVKAVCALLGNIETLQITHAVDNFVNVCREFPKNRVNARNKSEIISESGDYSVIRLGSDDSVTSNINYCCDQIRTAVQGLIQMYSHIFRVDFHLSTPSQVVETQKYSSEIVDSVLIYIGCVHHLLSKWQYNEYRVEAQIFHGTRPISQRISSTNALASSGFQPRIVFDCWLNFETTSVSVLPRESRIVITAYGILFGEDQGQSSSPVQEELGWGAIQLFDYNGYIVKGNFLLSLWPGGDNSKKVGPAPCPGTHPNGDVAPIIGIELPDYGGQIKFPQIEKVNNNKQTFQDFNSLDINTQQQLLDIIHQDSFTRPQIELREVLWEKRHYLLEHPQALPKVLLAAQSWDYTSLPELHSILEAWTPMDPVSALQLLLPMFPDEVVRTFAVNWIRKLTNDQMVDYFPQIVQALKYENYEASELSKFLLERSLSSPRVAHHLYWLLVHELPGETPQNTCDPVAQDESRISDARYYRRLQLILRALIAISGESLRKTFMSQQLLVKGLAEVADNVKTCKESTRLNVLMQGLHNVSSTLSSSPTCLPLNPALYVNGIQVKSSSYFPSNTLPLKINFTNEESDIMPAIFKVGDDLQQDMLTLQMICIMDKLWLKEGVDLKMVTFQCVPTGHKKGMIELVSEAETLRKIQVEFGLTGSFKDRPIAEWLAKHNPSALDYERAVNNFTASCAGYCVATYVLGICDRHNDNIMLKTSGHLFHIDFGKFLGDAQMFGNFKRDRTPFVLTSDMAYVINGGDKPTARFHHFVDLCCQAFNIVRKESNIILNLFLLMAASGAGGLTIESVEYVQNALLPHLTDAEAAASFARMIQSSLKSWFTQFNFFLHNLSQLRFTGDHNDGGLLSFVPKVYNMQQEGRIKNVEVFKFQKRYDPEKYYVYILRVDRENQQVPSYLFRSFKEFCEFHHKLFILFPLATPRVSSLQGSSLHVGRSNIKQVAAKRMVEIKKFLNTLFKMADEICHSDLVYTFFHPLLRDQQESSIHEHKVKDRKKDRLTNNMPGRITGQIKLSMHYQRDTLWVMVHHVQELSCLINGQEPSTYVKVYLKPDHSKATKRKTKIIRRNCHPSFMEMLEYRMPLEIVKHRYLQATVWNHDTLQENEFLGGAEIVLSSMDLTKEKAVWYPLVQITR
ncbi:phosphatidylinositol 4-phosphate 3-kinase C2 domain-containing subunit alpha isoform X2 [Cimex lectularius]|uniref:Phosphatidylinositol-4-phosphate 3-kinase n=1 Tax=Cimex lectularius TaxID=79782 RepID=A0A8I6SRX5_CIMLE|nr:phosphatidylinositol 4-phosphate 3-kinase C2 domain-containing subunit alpha isoform X2 [Cimex lectularius]